MRYHIQNNNFRRLKELTRTYNTRPSKALKAIIEKDLNLEKCSMPPFPAEQDLTHMFATNINEYKESIKYDQIDY